MEEASLEDKMKILMRKSKLSAESALSKLNLNEKVLLVLVVSYLYLFDVFTSRMFLEFSLLVLVFGELQLNNQIMI